MQSYLSHLQFNVRPENLPFYRDLLLFLGWQPIYDSAEMLGMSGPNRVGLWFVEQATQAANDHDGPGLNHLAIGVPAQADVDSAATYLTEHNVAHLFDTPQHRPEFSSGDDQTYYQVMCESPDHILLEVVYIGPKDAR